MTRLLDLLRDLPARDRERLMLAAIGEIARGEISASSVPDPDELRQLAYLASLARNRVSRGRDKLTEFLADARLRMPDSDRPDIKDPMDPLQALMGAAFGIDCGKIRSEADLHIRTRPDVNG